MLSETIEHRLSFRVGKWVPVVGEVDEALQRRLDAEVSALELRQDLLEELLVEGALPFGA